MGCHPSQSPARPDLTYMTDVAVAMTLPEFLSTHEVGGLTVDERRLIAAEPPIAEVARVDYSYYTNETYGDVGGLKQATVTLPLTDSGISSTRKTRYFGQVAA